MEEDNSVDLFDAVILGTSLSATIVGAALTHRGKRVLLTDYESTYGGFEAALTIDEMCELAEKNIVTSKGDPLTFTERQRQRARFSLLPRVVYTAGLMLRLFQKSGVYEYMQFVRSEQIKYIREGDEGTLCAAPLPISREQLLTSTDLSTDERLAMKQLATAALGAEQNAAGEAALFLRQYETAKASPAVDAEYDGFWVAQQSESLPPSGVTLPEWLREHSISELGCLRASTITPFPFDALDARSFVEKVRLQLSSVNYITSSPLLLSNYGPGDFPQAFTRFAAVRGAICALGTRIEPQEDKTPMPELASGEYGALHKLSIVDSDIKPMYFRTGIWVAPEIVQGIHGASALAFSLALMKKEVWERTPLAQLGVAQRTVFFADLDVSVCGYVTTQKEGINELLGVYLWLQRERADALPQLTERFLGPAIDDSLIYYYKLDSLNNEQGRIAMPDVNTRVVHCVTGFGPGDLDMEVTAARETLAAILGHDEELFPEEAEKNTDKDVNYDLDHVLGDLDRMEA